ncbi:MAG: glycosyltransferase family 2 protein [Candidatus Acidiferrum sp.]
MGPVPRDVSDLSLVGLGGDSEVKNESSISESATSSSQPEPCNAGGPVISADLGTCPENAFPRTKFVPPTCATVCAVVVTHHPDGGLCDRIRRIVSQVSDTVVVDNGSSSNCVEQLRTLARDLDVQLVLNHCNEGLANALNAGCQWAAEHGYPWVLYLDQDTVAMPDMVETLSEAFGCYPRPDQLAVIGSNRRDKRNGWISSDGDALLKSCSAVERVVVLMSGSLLSMGVFQAIGGFRADFFIDCVDFEYCLRARSKGFHVLKTVRPVMEHAIGHPTEHRLLWKTVVASNHSPMRHYFVARNSLIMVGKYFLQEPKWMGKYVWAWIKLFVCVVLFEEQRIFKLMSIVRGCFDGILGRTEWHPH